MYFTITFMCENIRYYYYYYYVLLNVGKFIQILL